jgi:PAS domain S-box-containing protein
MQGRSPEGIRVLHVEDESSFAELTSKYLESELEDVEIALETSPDDALSRLAEEAFDCIISDYNMPGRNGIEFLEAVREEWPDLPFILFTGRGSEEVASDAISAGVTDYLQKDTTPEQYTVLANRIKNAVAQHRAEQEIEETKRWYQTILEHSSDYVMVVDEMGDVSYISPAVERVMGYTPEELLGTNSFEYTHPDDIDQAAETLSEIVTDPEKEATVEFRSKHKDGSWRWLEVRGRNLFSDPVINGVMVNVRDITERKKREQELKNETERLQNVASFISHDMRNQLSVLSGQVGLLDEQTDESVSSASEAIDRLETMIDKIAKLAQGGTLPEEPKPVDLESVAEMCWHNTVGRDRELIVDSEVTVTADESRLQSLLENLFLNAVEHGNAETIHIGKLDDDGFYVEDDGTGLPDTDPERVFEAGYTTSEDGTGLGLSIVKNIADTHEWSTDVRESDGGGVRFEFTDVSIT